MGCFAWLTSKKAKVKARKADKKAEKKETKRRNEIADDNLVTNIYRDRVAFDVGCASPRLLNSREDAINETMMWDIKRREQILRRVEANKVAARIREAYADRRDLLDRECRQNARVTILRKARLEYMERRCLSREDEVEDAMPSTYIEDDELVVLNRSRRRDMEGYEHCDSDVN